MSLSSQIELNALIADVAAIAAERLPAADHARLAPYFTAYFEEAEAADLKRAAPLDLYGAAMAHLDFAGERLPGQHKVRAYNPDFERHGWQSTHTHTHTYNHSSSTHSHYHNNSSRGYHPRLRRCTLFWGRTLLTAQKRAPGSLQRKESSAFKVHGES
jgi:hypothetical protein